MLARVFVSLLFVCALAGAGHAEDECVFQRVVTLSTPPEDFGHLMIPAEIGGRPTHLLLDTGGAWSLIDEELATQIGGQIRHLPGEYGSFNDAAGNKIDRYLTVPTMKIGTLAFPRPVDFLIAPLARGRSTERFGGSLGLNVLSKFDVEVDNAKQQVTLFLPAPVATCGVYWANDAAAFHFTLHGDIPFTRAVIDGEEVDALIDTGSSRTVIDADFARRHFGLSATSPGVADSGPQMLPGGKAAQFYSASVKVLSVSGIRFENVPVELAQLDDIRLILGMNELRRLHLYFNFKGRTIYATAADAGLEAQPPAAAAP